MSRAATLISHSMTTELVLLRRGHALSQDELADLIGISQRHVGRIEDMSDDIVRAIRLETAFGLQVVFGKKPGQLFSRLLREIEDAVMMRATKLDRSLDGKDDQATRHKRALLSDMARRASNRAPSP